MMVGAEIPPYRDDEEDSEFTRAEPIDQLMGSGMLPFNIGYEPAQ